MTGLHFETELEETIVKNRQKLPPLVLLGALCSTANAAPFLVCDPYPSSGPQPTEFLVTVGTAAPVTVPATRQTDGSVILKRDVAGIGTGAKTVTAKAKNAWGESAASAPFSFVAGAPPAAAGMRLVPQ